MELTAAQLDRACGVLVATAAGDALGAPRNRQDPVGALQVNEVSAPLTYERPRGRSGLPLHTFGWQVLAVGLLYNFIAACTSTRPRPTKWWP